MKTEVDLYLTFISCLQKYLQNLDYCWCLMYDCIVINHQIFASSQCIPSLTCLSLQMLQKLFHTSTGRKTRHKNLSRETPWASKIRAKVFMKRLIKLVHLWLLDAVRGGCDDFVSTNDIQLSEWNHEQWQLFGGSNH